MSPQSRPPNNLHRSALLPLDGISAKLENDGTLSNQAAKGLFVSTILTVDVNKSIAVDELFLFTNDIRQASLSMKHIPSLPSNTPRKCHRTNISIHFHFTNNLLPNILYQKPCQVTRNCASKDITNLVVGIYHQSPPSPNIVLKGTIREYKHRCFNVVHTDLLRSDITYQHPYQITQFRL